MAKRAVYVLEQLDGVVVYVGSTDNPARRFAQHKVIKRWKGPELKMRVVAWYPTRTEGFTRETALIHQLRPPLNTTKMDTSDVPPGVRAKLLAWIRENDGTLTKFAERAEVDRLYLQRVLHGDVTNDRVRAVFVAKVSAATDEHVSAGEWCR